MAKGWGCPARSWCKGTTLYTNKHSSKTHKVDATKKGSDLGGTATQTCTKQVRVVYALACECEGGVAVW